jgi:hypothetical protein
MLLSLHRKNTASQQTYCMCFQLLSPISRLARERPAPQQMPDSSGIKICSLRGRNKTPRNVQMES